MDAKENASYRPKDSKQMKTQTKQFKDASKILILNLVRYEGLNMSIEMSHDTDYIWTS